MVLGFGGHLAIARLHDADGISWAWRCRRSGCTSGDEDEGGGGAVLGWRGAGGFGAAERRASGASRGGFGAAGEMGLRVPTQGGFEQRRRGRAGDEFSAGGRGFGGAAPERENLGERKIG